MTEYHDRIADLANRAQADRKAFDSPENPPDEERALSILRSGVGEVVAVYVEGRTGEFARFDEWEMERLEQALNDWLALYARCYGYEIEIEFTVREVAELVIKTHDIHDTVQLLTHVPNPEVRRKRA